MNVRSVVCAMNPVVYEAFGPVPESVAPSTLVRRWDQALLSSAFVFAAAYPALTWLAFKLPNSPQHALVSDLLGSASLALHYATATIAFTKPAAAYVASLAAPVSTLVRTLPSLLFAVGAAAWVAKRALVPCSNTWHVSGPRLLEGDQALRECAARSLTMKQAIEEPGCMRLHPALLLPKKHWARHTLIYGSVGSGKTVILLQILNQIIRRNQKVFIYDSKGDFTSKFRRPIIVSPFDSRSYTWDVGRDVKTPTQASAFASSLIPDDPGPGKYWSAAAQQLLIGALRFLQNEKGTEWGWKDLADALAQSAPDMLPMLQAHYGKAAPLVANAEAQSTASLLATLATYTRCIDDLALAWPERTKRAFSITDWVTDDYKGRKQVVVQSGGDASLTRAYVSALVNVCVPAIISPSLADNESRFIGFIFDELATAGKLNIMPMLAVGRSKGVVLMLGLQDLAQLRQVYGDNEAQAMRSMVGTQIICQVGLGETRDELAARLGKHRKAFRAHGANAQVHEENRNLISGGELTDRLGFRKGKKFGREGWGIRAIVQMGGDPLLLDFPGVSFSRVRRAIWR